MFDFDYKLIRKSRKRASITVKDNLVVVSVPLNFPDKRVSAFLAQHYKWIEKKLMFNREVINRYEPKEYTNGELFSYLGRDFPLDISDKNHHNANEISLNDRKISLQVPASISGEKRDEFILARLANWYKKQALLELSGKTERLSSQFKLKTPSKVGVKSYKSRWGTCNSRGEIYYNWRIIIAPHEVVNSIVIHELCHLIYFNHSKEFWRLVNSICPDYKTHKQWLKINGGLLNIH